MIEDKHDLMNLLYLVCPKYILAKYMSEVNVMKFIGRESEQKELKEFLESDSQEAALIYGRRRIGKTELIIHSIQDIPFKKVYFQCLESTRQQNCEELSRAVSEAFGLPSVQFSTLNDILRFLFSAAEKEKIVLVLDEYPYLRNCVKGCDSILQSFLDRYRSTSHLKLIVCGSYMTVMKELTDYENPLYGRFTIKIKLEQMDYLDTAEFYPSYSDKDKVKLYSIFGGIPYYNSLVNENQSVTENIIRLMLSDHAPLKDEVPLYLQKEINKAENANSVFNAIAAGKTKFKDIFVSSGLQSDAALNNLLLKLSDIEVIQKDYPINAPTDRKKAHYRIADRLTLFYYSYVFRNVSALNLMDPEAFYQNIIQDDFESQFVPHAFEEICRQFLLRSNKAGRINPPLEALGKYYYDDPVNKTNGEFDIVSKDQNGFTYYEVKYRNTPVSDTMINTETEQVRHSPLQAYRYGFFSKSGYNLKENHPECIFYTLDDLYNFNQS